MKLRTTHELVDSNGTVTHTFTVLEQDYTANQNEDIEHELTHDSTGGPKIRPKTPPRH